MPHSPSDRQGYGPSSHVFHDASLGSAIISWHQFRASKINTNNNEAMYVSSCEPSISKMTHLTCIGIHRGALYWCLAGLVTQHQSEMQQKSAGAYFFAGLMVPAGLYCSCPARGCAHCRCRTKAVKGLGVTQSLLIAFKP